MHLDDHGRFKVFAEPTDGSVYAVGADVAEGIEGGDFSSAFVIDRDLNHVASWYGHVDPDLFGKILCRIGEYYHNALLAPEINNHGHTVITKIKNLGYSNTFTRQVKEERAEGYTKKIGWRTDKKTKMLMLDEFVEHIRDNLITIRDTELLKEMTTLYIDTDGDISLNGKDRVVAACIALQAIKQTAEGIYKAVNPVKQEKTYKTLLERNEHNRSKDESYFE